MTTIEELFGSDHSNEAPRSDDSDYEPSEHAHSDNETEKVSPIAYSEFIKIMRETLNPFLKKSTTKSAFSDTLKPVLIEHKDILSANGILIQLGNDTATTTISEVATTLGCAPERTPEVAKAVISCLESLAEVLRIPTSELYHEVCNISKRNDKLTRENVKIKNQLTELDKLYKENLKTLEELKSRDNPISLQEDEADELSRDRDTDTPSSSGMTKAKWMSSSLVLQELRHPKPPAKSQQPERQADLQGTPNFDSLKRRNLSSIPMPKWQDDSAMTFDRFVRAFELRYNPKEWEAAELCCLFQENLSGKLKLLYDQLDRYRADTDYEYVINSLKRKFENDTTRQSITCRKALNNIKKEGRSVTEIIRFIEKNVRLGYPDGSDVLKAEISCQALMDSLQPEWHNAHSILEIARRSKPGQGFEEAKRAALDYEAYSTPAASTHEKGGQERKKRLRNVFDKPKTSTPITCLKCGRNNHAADKCYAKSKFGEKKDFQSKDLSTTAVSKPSTTPRTLSVILENTCNYVTGIGPETNVSVELLGKIVTAIADTGSQVSVLPHTVLNEARKRGINIDELECLEMESHQFTSAGGTPLNLVAKVVIPTYFNGSKVDVAYYVSKTGLSTILLGTEALREAGFELSFGGRNLLEKEVLCARVATRIVVPSGFSKNVVLRSDRKIGTYFLQSNHSAVPDSIVEIQNGMAQVEIINPSIHPLIINKGDSIGSLYDEFELSTELPSLNCWTIRNESLSYEDNWKVMIKANETASWSEEIRIFLKSFADIFIVSDNELGSTLLPPCSIDVGSAEPIKQKPRKLPPALSNQVQAMIADQIAKGIVEPSSSPWSSPLVVVVKKDKSLRLCVDYRAVNKIIKKDAFPLPQMDSILHNLSKKKVFSALDLKAGFWQMPLDSSSKEITAFSTPAGHYQFSVLPFGMTNSPAAFQRAMNSIFSKLKLDNEAHVYLDDVIVATDTEQRHSVVMRTLLEEFRKIGLKLNAEKCKLFHKEISFLGHIVNGKGISTDPDKVRAIQEFVRPNNASQLKTFLGMASYYRKFIHQFSKIAQPLNEATSPTKTWNWTDDHEKAFITLKDKMCTPPILVQPDFEAAIDGSRPFILFSDASRSGLGVALAQKGLDNFLHPIAFASKGLTKAQKNYSVSDLEGLGLVFAVEKFHSFIFNTHVIVFTDHLPLCSILKRSNITGRMLRWVTYLQQYDLEIKHIKGSANAIADALSRSLPAIDLDSAPSDDIALVAAISRQKENDVGWLSLLKKESLFAQIIDDIKNDHFNSYNMPSLTHRLTTADFKIRGSNLFMIDKNDGELIIIPEEKRKKLFEEQHYHKLNGHVNANSLYTKMRKFAFWPTMRNDLKKWHLECHTCLASNKRNVLNAPLTPIITKAPFELVCVDLIEMPTSKSGNKFILTILDHFSKFGTAFALPNKQAINIASILVNDYICKNGRWPTAIQSDRGHEFENLLTNEISKLTGISWLTTKGWNSRANGAAERFNQTVLHLLTKMNVDVNSWDETLPFAIYAYNSSPHSATKTSPLKLLYGIDPPLTSNIVRFDKPNSYQNLAQGLAAAREQARLATESYAQKSKQAFDKKHKTEKLVYPQIGDKVYIKMPKKGLPEDKIVKPIEGPFLVIDRSTNSATLKHLTLKNRAKKVVPFEYLVILPPGMKEITLGTKRGENIWKKKVNVNLIQCFFRPIHIAATACDPMYNCESILDNLPCSIMTKTLGEICKDHVQFPEVIGSKKFTNIRDLAAALTAHAVLPITAAISAVFQPKNFVINVDSLALAWKVARPFCIHMACDTENAKDSPIFHKEEFGLSSDDFSKAWSLSLAEEKPAKTAGNATHVEKEQKNPEVPEKMLILPIQFSKGVDSLCAMPGCRFMILADMTLPELHVLTLKKNTTIFWILPLAVSMKNEQIDFHLSTVAKDLDRTGSNLTVTAGPFGFTSWSSVRQQFDDQLKKAKSKWTDDKFPIRILYDPPSMSIFEPWFCLGAHPLSQFSDQFSVEQITQFFKALAKKDPNLMQGELCKIIPRRNLKRPYQPHHRQTTRQDINQRKQQYRRKPQMPRPQYRRSRTIVLTPPACQDNALMPNQ